MVEHEIVQNGDGFSVRIYDAPASGWRILFEQKEGAIGTYTTYDDAMAGVRVYDRSDKTVLFEAELDVYRQAARTGGRLAVVAYLRWFVSASLIIAPTPPSFCQKTSSESPP